MNDVTVTVRTQEMNGERLSVSYTNIVRISSHAARPDLVQIFIDGVWIAVFPEDLIAAVRAVQRGTTHHD